MNTEASEVVGGPFWMSFERPNAWRMSGGPSAYGLVALAAVHSIRLFDAAAESHLTLNWMTVSSSSTSGLYSRVRGPSSAETR